MINIKICFREGCENVHLKNGLYCSSECANKRTHSSETKNKIKQSLENYYNQTGKIRPRRKVVYVDKICKICQKIFTVTLSKKNKMHCSDECFQKYREKHTGGYREGSGRAHCGYYKGYYCGSSYELCWLIYQLDHGIQVQRFPSSITDGNLVYIPDFLLNDDIIVELKGYENNLSVLAKKELAEKNGYTVQLLYKEDLQHCFEWVKKNYTYKHIKDLYDGKPKYTYTCFQCNTTFDTNIKRKKRTHFCSRKCAVLYNKKINK